MRKLISKEQVEKFEAVSDKAKALALTFMMDELPEMQYAIMDLPDCESPIEEILRVAIGIMIIKRKNDIFQTCILPQCELDCNGTIYRVDFYVSGARYDTGKEVTIVVECDGHDYHHATKEQVQRDYERDYNIKLAGFDVLRFSGSQIYNEPAKCANDILDYLEARLREDGE